jgi:hypothetical protein
VIEIQAQDGWYIVHTPKSLLVMTKAEFIQALRRGKWWKRRQALDQRQAQALDEHAAAIPEGS